MSLLSRYITSNLLMDDDFYSTARSFLRPFTSYNYPSSRSRLNRLSDDRLKIEVELAGFRRDQIEVYEENGYLVVSAKDDNEASSRKYSDSWLLMEGSKVDKVKFENGLLTIDVSKVVPPKPPRTSYKIE